MKRRSFCLLLACAPAIAWTAQGRIFRVAWVSTDQQSSPSPFLNAFRTGLADRGYVEGRDVTIQTWWGEGSGERIEQVARDIVASQPDVVVAAGGLALFALNHAGVQAPIVFSISADPVEAKVAESFARPGRNMTGISLFTLALVGKRLQLLKDAVPGVKRVALVANPQHPGEPLERDAATMAAVPLGLSIRYFPVQSAAQLDQALAEIARGRDEAIVVFADGFTMGFAGRIAEFSQQTRIPAIDGWAPFARAGNLLTYGPNVEDVYRRLAVYVDNILKGARAAELPVELPTKVELVVNLKTAKSLGIVIPQSLLLRADEVIQ